MSVITLEQETGLDLEPGSVAARALMLVLVKDSRMGLEMAVKWEVASVAASGL